jgi:hypothetical protein
LLVLGGVALIACQGEVGEPSAFTRPDPQVASDVARPDGTRSGPTPARTPGTAAGGADAPAAAAPQPMQAPPPPPWEAAFGIDDSQPALLPVEMRLRRLAAVLGLPVADPLFDGVRSARIALGGHDHAQGVLPDGLWIASRMTAWVRVLQPICNSQAMQERYPALPQALPELLRAAWGRPAEAADMADFEPLFAAGGDAALQYETACLAVFSAAEFVYQ